MAWIFGWLWHYNPSLLQHYFLIFQSAEVWNCPITSAEWAAVSTYQLDTCRWKVFAAKAAPFRTYESSWVNELSALSSLSLFAHLVSFYPPCACRRGRSSATANSLSDERDKWQRCFGSGDSALRRNSVCVRFVRARRRRCVFGGQEQIEAGRRETEGDRCQSPDD